MVSGWRFSDVYWRCRMTVLSVGAGEAEEIRGEADRAVAEGGAK